MHELFLTTIVSAADFERATAVLQGLCAMDAWPAAHRVLFFAGPPQPRGGLVATRSIPPSPHVKLWQELSGHLARQSYVVQARYEVLRERDFGGGGGGGGDAAPVNGNVFAKFNATPGTLRWTNMPDPTGARPVMQRRKVEIPEQRNLPAVLQENNFRFKSELLEESHSYFRDGIEYSLVRYHRLPLASQGTKNAPQPLPQLPAWDSIVPSSSSSSSSSPPSAVPPLDPSGKWLLYVRSHVLEDTQPERMQKANDALSAVRDELAGIFDFRAFDRRAFDTRAGGPVAAGGGGAAAAARGGGPRGGGPGGRPQHPQPQLVSTSPIPLPKTIRG